VFSSLAIVAVARWITGKGQAEIDGEAWLFRSVVAMAGVADVGYRDRWLVLPADGVSDRQLVVPSGNRPKDTSESWGPNSTRSSSARDAVLAIINAMKRG
jgi:hypothetical protein